MSVLKQTEKIRSIVVSVLCRKIAGFSPSRCLSWSVVEKRKIILPVFYSPKFSPTAFV